jgi:hypothetical protein
MQNKQLTTNRMAFAPVPLFIDPLIHTDSYLEARDENGPNWKELPTLFKFPDPVQFSRVLRKIAQPNVFDQPLTKRGHRSSL